ARLHRALPNLHPRAQRRTMAAERAERIKNAQSRQFSPGWDPKRLWISSLDEKAGVMTISGGAQSTTDVTQFALRMQASVFFTDVQPVSVAQSTDTGSKLLVYRFTLTGKVLY